MATIITMPRLSDTMEEGTVASWLKSVGDTVGEGDILAEIETDKATMEFESFHEGTLLHIGIAEGETANVDALLAIIGEKGEDISMHLNPSSSQTAPDTVSQEDTQQTKEVAPTAEAAAIPEGVEVITMPRLSDTMEEGTVATWLKKEGDSIQEGDILAEIETDKATMEFESFYTGTLLKIGIQEGETALVDALLAIVGPAGTDVSGISQATKAAPDATPVSAPAPAPVKETPVAAPIAQVVTEVASTNASSQRIFASPLAKKMATDKGISLQLVKGSGENGRIVKSDIENGITKLLYVAPESLIKEEYVSFLKKQTISFVAIDEAHCISEWGHDFRPEYRNLKHIIKAIDNVPIIGLTATATEKVQEDILKTLGISDANRFKASFNRANLFYEVRPKTKEVEKDIIRFVKQRIGKSGIIYCLSRKKVEEVAQILQVNGI